jgi:hypothetical protein
LPSFATGSGCGIAFSFLLAYWLRFPIDRVVAQQALQPLSVRAFDAYAGIHREAPAMFPGQHGLGLVGFDPTTLHEHAQHAAADTGLHFDDHLGIAAS